jgi:polyisoprenyl-teichoic acid--peptidoglycan teichoic acid transferase
MRGRRLLAAVIAAILWTSIAASMAILILLIVGSLVVPHPSLLPGDNRFLIIGLTQDRSRDDTIMVVQWDEPRHEARILGVPRDTAITLPGIGTTKLAHAYATGGSERARDAVAALLNIPIAHYVVFSLPAMRHIVDLLGGVPVTVEKRMVYTDREQGLLIDLQPGPQVLDGVHAEQYLRFRNDPDGDIGRIRRQQRFVRAVLAAARRPTAWIRLPWIVATSRAEVQTDLTTLQILGWIGRANALTPDATSAYTIEGQPVVLWDDLAQMNLDFWQADTEDLHAKVRWLVTGVLPPASVPGTTLPYAKMAPDASLPCPGTGYTLL